MTILSTQCKVYTMHWAVEFIELNTGTAGYTIAEKIMAVVFVVFV